MKRNLVAKIALSIITIVIVSFLLADLINMCKELAVWKKYSSEFIDFSSDNIYFEQLQILRKKIALDFFAMLVPIILTLTLWFHDRLFKPLTPEQLEIRAQKKRDRLERQRERLENKREKIDQTLNDIKKDGE